MSRGGSVSPPTSRRPAVRPFSSSGWLTVVSPASRRRRDVVVADDREVLAARFARGTQAAEGELVAGEHDGGEARLALEQGAQAVGSRLRRVPGALLPRVVLGTDPRRLERLPPAAQPRGRHGVDRGGLAARVERAVVVVVGRPEAHGADAAVPEREQMPGGQPRARLVVDADERVRAGPRLVDEHDRHPAGDHGVEVGGAGRERVHAEPGDDGALDGLRHARRAVAGAGEHQQPEPGLLDRARESLHEQDRRGIGEGVREPAGRQEPDRLPPPGAQAAGRGVGTGVAELGGDRQDPLAELGGELVRAVVRVGDRRPRHAEPVGDRLEGHAVPAHAGVLTRRSRMGALARPGGWGRRVERRARASG